MTVTLRSASVYDVSHVGRLREKRRFKCQEEAVRPREHVHSIRKTFHLETFDDDDDDDRLELLRHPRAIPSGFEIVKEFVEVPCEFLLIGHWSPVSSFGWFRAEDTLVLEARSSLYAARDACVRVQEPSKILFLVDNLRLVLALDKCRSSHNFTLNNILRNEQQR